MPLYILYTKQRMSKYREMYASRDGRTADADGRSALHFKSLISSKTFNLITCSRKIMSMIINYNVFNVFNWIGNNKVKFKIPSQSIFFK